jgi:CRP-like cAMP-binding protein
MAILFSTVSQTWTRSPPTGHASPRRFAAAMAASCIPRLGQVRLIVPRVDGSSPLQTVLLFKGAPARLAQTLLDLARDHGVRDAEGVLVPLKLSQQDLASLIGVTRESVNLALADFRARGLVEQEGRHLRIRSSDELRALV